MAQFDRQDKFESGNRHIDVQHRQLFENILACIDAARHGSTASEQVNCLQHIQQCLNEHFKYEEMLMSESGREISDHKSQHAFISRILDDEILKFKNNAEGRNSAQGILFNLHDWYMLHLDSDNNFWRHNNSFPSGIIPVAFPRQ